MAEEKTSSRVLNYAFINGDVVLDIVALHSYLEAEEFLRAKQSYANWYQGARIFLEISGNKNASG